MLSWGSWGSWRSNISESDREAFVPRYLEPCTFSHSRPSWTTTSSSVDSLRINFGFPITAMPSLMSIVSVSRLYNSIFHNHYPLSVIPYSYSYLPLLECDAACICNHVAFLVAGTVQYSFVESVQCIYPIAYAAEESNIHPFLSPPICRPVLSANPSALVPYLRA